MNRTASTRTYSKPDQSGLGGDAKVIVTDHLRKQAAAKGFAMSQIISALKDPYKVTRVMSRPEFIEAGQLRYCGYGVAVVVAPQADGSLVLKTVYADGVRTELRADQMNDRYALASNRVARRGGLAYSC